MRIFYIYVSPRETVEKNVKNGTGPDTLLYGLNHLQKNNEVSFSDSGFKKNFWWLISFPIETILIALTGYGFKLGQAISLLRQIKNRDVIVTCAGSAGLPIALLKMLGLIKKPKLILLNIGIIESWKRFPFLVQRLYPRLYKKFDKIICLSKAERESLIDVLDLPKSKVEFIELGIDTNFFSSKKVRPNTKVSYLLSVGRDKYRDHNLLFKISQKLKLPVRLVTSKRNLVNSVIPAGVKIYFDLDYNALRRMYAGARLILLPTKVVARASGQLVMLESLAMGKAVVATASPGLLSGYDNLHNIVQTVNSNSASEFASVVGRLIADTVNLQRIEHLGERIVRKNYTTAIMAGKIDKLINSINK